MTTILFPFPGPVRTLIPSLPPASPVIETAEFSPSFSMANGLHSRMTGMVGPRHLQDRQRSLDALYDHYRRMGNPEPQAASQTAWLQGGRLCFARSPHDNESSLRSEYGELSDLVFKKPTIDNWSVVADRFLEEGDQFGDVIALTVKLTQSPHSPSRMEWERKRKRILDYFWNPVAKPETFHFRFNLEEGLLLTLMPEHLPKLRQLLQSDYGLFLFGIKVPSPKNIPELLSLPLRLRHLAIRGIDFSDDDIRLPDESISLIVQSKRFSGLTSLGLTHQRLSLAQVRLITESRTLSKLRFLDLNSAIFDREAVRLIAASKTLSKLTSLNLSNVGLGVPEIQAITRSRTLSKLVSLDLSGNGLSRESLRALAESRNLSRLTSLNVEDTGSPVGPEDGIWEMMEEKFENVERFR